MKKLSKQTPDEIKLALIESMLELGIYEINPVKGNMPATVAQGGVK